MWTTASAATVAPIKHAITEFLNDHTRDLPGQASFSIGTINASGLPDDCVNLSVSMDSNARPWGKTHVNVRCTEGSPWRMYVPVEIHVLVNYVVTARPLTAGQIISATDIRQRQGDLADLPQGILTDLTQAIGQLSRVSLPADRPLRTDMLRLPLVVKQGQNVKVVSGGANFQVSSDGRALNNAAMGQVVQVRLASGQVLSGIAQKDGTIAINY
jgi:flagella basal body P-ring formation protein FlgA